MKANLMFRDRAFDLEARTCYGRTMLSADLELERVLGAMSGGDKVIFAVCGVAMFTPLQSIDEIKYRQETLADARKNSDALRYLYSVTVELDTLRGGGWRAFSTSTVSDIYNQALSLIELYMKSLAYVRSAVDKDAGSFTSDGFKKLYAELGANLDKSFFTEAKRQIGELQDINEVLVSGKLGPGIHGVDYTLRKKSGGPLQWVRAPSYTYGDGGMSSLGLDDLSNRRDRALNSMAYTLAQIVRYLETFFDSLRRELAFYVGCLNLEKKMASLNLPMSTPTILPIESRSRAWRGVYDGSLALTKNGAVVGNDIETKDKKFYLISGANQGGKSTFLRSAGQAQLMAQCGMPIFAESASIPLRRAVFTHFKREEDRGMRSGKLDEELVRLSEAAEYITPDSMLLLNESFTSTNEREGSEISRQVTRAFVENGVELFAVSHLYDYASSFIGDKDTHFLRAQRMQDGSRTFRLENGEPLTTAFGKDLYIKIFGEE